MVAVLAGSRPKPNSKNIERFCNLPKFLRSLVCILSQNINRTQNEAIQVIGAQCTDVYPYVFL